MATKKSEIIFNKNVSNNEFENIFNEFSKNKGYMTKLLNKNENEVIGYLVRAEIPEFENFVAISFVPCPDIYKYNKKMNQRFTKCVAMNKVLNGGTRKLLKYIKEHGTVDSFESETILKNIIAPENLYKETLDYYKSDNFSYEDIYNYIIAFENKIKTYYNNKNIKIVVI